MATQKKPSPAKQARRRTARQSRPLSCALPIKPDPNDKDDDQALNLRWDEGLLATLESEGVDVSALRRVDELAHAQVVNE